MTIFIFGDIAFIRDILNFLAALTSGVGGAGGDFTGLLRLAMAIGVLSAVVLGLAGGGRLSILPLFAVFIVMMALVAPKRTVTLENVYTGATATVANVPLGVAFAGSLFSRIGLFLAETFEAGLADPRFTADGFASALDDWRAIRLNASSGSAYAAANNAGGGDFARSWIEYVSTCTAFGLDIGTLTTTAVETGQFAHLAVYNPNPALGARVYTTATPADLDCVQAHAQLLAYSRATFLPALKASVLQSVMFDRTRESAPSVASVETRMLTMLAAFGAGGVDPDEALLSLYVGSLVDHGYLRRLSLDLKDSYAIMLGDAIRARNAQWTAQGDVFRTYALPALSFVEGFFLAVAPIAVVVAFLSGVAGVRYLGRFAMLGLWIQLWAPCFAIVNLYIYHYVGGDLANLDGAALVPTSIAGQFAADSVVQRYLATAGLFASATPFMALFLLTGSVYTFNSIAGQISGPDTISETNAARPTLAAAPVTQQLPDYEWSPIAGRTAPGTADLLPRFRIGRETSESRQSAERELAGHRAQFLEAVEKALASSSGTRGSSIEGGMWSESRASSGSRAYSFVRGDDFSDVVEEMRSAGVSQSTIDRFTLSAAAAGARGFFDSGGKDPMLNFTATGAAVRDVASTTSAEQANRWASAIASRMGESRDRSAALVESLAHDQQSGWQEVGYTDKSLTSSSTVRQEGADYADAQRSYESSVSASQSGGASQEVSAPFLAQMIRTNPQMRSEFYQTLHGHMLAREAGDWQGLYLDTKLFANDREGREDAFISGGLKAMERAGRDDLIRSTLRGFGMDYQGATDAGRYAGVGGELGDGPAVSVGGEGVGGYGGRDGAGFGQSLEQRHEAGVAAIRDEATAAAAPRVQADLEAGLVRAEREADDVGVIEAAASAVSSVGRAGWLGALNTLGLNQTYQSFLEDYRGDAFAQGLTEAQADLYAVRRATVGSWSSQADEQIRTLESKVLEEYADVPKAGETALARIQDAAKRTGTEKDRLLAEVGSLNDRLGIDNLEEEMNIYERGARERQ